MTQTKIAFITTTPTDVVPFISAVKSISERIGLVVKAYLRIEGDFMGVSDLDEFIQFAQKSHIVILHLMGGKTSLPEFDWLMSSLQGAGVPILVAPTVFGRDKELMRLSTVDQDDYRNILRYLNYGGTKNFENLLLYLTNRFTGANYEVSAPERPPWEGIYHPDFEYLPTIDEYLEKKYVSGRLTVGLLFHQSYWLAGNTSFIDSLIKEIERQGANVIPVFLHGAKDADLGTKGLEWIVENYFMKGEKPLIDVIVSTQAFSLSICLPSSETVDGFLKKLGIPIIKAILTCNTLEEWRDSPQGLNPIDIHSSIAMPEFDGILITVPVAAMKFSEIDPLTGTKVVKFEPIPERVGKLVRLSLNWAKLRRIPNKEKKVAIIFHNYPPRNDTIGCAFGLDSPVSVWNILRDLREAGYRLDYLPENGQKLIEDIIKRVTNDRRWASSKELAERTVAKITREQYLEWFQELPLEVRDKMEKNWGKPPGRLFSYKGELLVPGLINGSVFIGLQPPRGFLDDPAAIYHSPDHPFPHHYYGYYRWIRDVFKANVIMHIGKHGTLEWLPGKSVGLSASCFPDIAISDLPNIYPYIINNIGEGTQAKRRSYCCIIDHLVPVMHNADAYGEMAELEVLLNEYYHAKTSDQGKLPYLQKLIWEKVCQAKLDHDLELSEETVFSDFDDFLEKLHDYLHDLTDTQIRDGLHILGEPPTDSRLEEFLVALTRLSNGDVPSLRQSIAEMKGYNYDDLIANRGKLNPDGKTNGDLITELNNLSLELVERFHSKGFKEQSIDAVLRDVLGGKSPNVRRCLAYIASFLIPALATTTNELIHTLSACEGIYIPPGPAGSPTRGMADILPTGRNFYSIDPRNIPSPAAWQVGVALGDALLKRYLKDEGKYPESIGTIIWATDTMKTKGDDIAEIFYLMGVKPVWEETSGRVIGVEVIPLEKLKRPRIDVTLRISGLFRDAFPVVVNLIEEAVEMVVNLKEAPEENYLAKHVATETKERVAQGADVEQAKAEACYRIFGDRPGAYGSGVSTVIDSKNWKDQKDLSSVYVTWGSYAYGRKNYGIYVSEQFKLRLSKIDLTVKNVDTREYDILDGDDWYACHGGMDVAVKTFKGKSPRSYYGDSSDPYRVKVRSTAEEVKHVFRARLLNPKWIEGVKRHGYKGAGDLSRTVDYVFGWDATDDIVEDWMYEELAQKYAMDGEMQEWLKDVNPYALQNIVERLLEAIERGMWQATEEMKKKLQELYLSIEGMLEEAGDSK
ncbi:MAG: cobaltochelatase subunit CobN [archaeon]|nr:cobaltochelatase subunit CobN [archaeon]